MDRSDRQDWLSLSRRSTLTSLGAVAGAIGTAGCMFDSEDGGNESMSPEPPDTDHPIGDRQGIQAIDPVSDRRRYRGYHVDAGIEVSVGSGDLGVDDTLTVSSGRYFVAGEPHDLANDVSVGIGDGPSPGAARWDVVHGTDSGIEVTAGGEEHPRPSDAQRRGVERPAPPQVSGTVLAWIWVSSESGAITDDDVIDRRLFGHSKPAKSEPFQLAAQTPTGKERGEPALAHNDARSFDPPTDPGAWTVHSERLFPRNEGDRFGRRTNPRQVIRFGNGLVGLWCQSMPTADEQDEDPDLANQTGSLLFSRDLVSWTGSPANPILAYNEEEWQGMRALAEALVWDDDRGQWAAMMSSTTSFEGGPPGVRAVGLAFNDELDKDTWEYPDDNPVITVDDIGDWIPGDGNRVYCRGLEKRDGTWYAFVLAGSSDPSNVAVGILTSDDLQTWSDHDANPVLEPQYDWENGSIAIDTPIQWNGRWYAPYRGTDWDKYGIAHADSITGPWEQSPEPVIDTEGTRWDGFEGVCLTPMGESWAALMAVYEDETREAASLGIATTGLGSDLLPDPHALEDGVESHILYDDFGDGRYDSGRIPTLPGDVTATVPRPEWSLDGGASGDVSVTDEALVLDRSSGNGGIYVSTPAIGEYVTWEIDVRVTDAWAEGSGEGGVSFDPWFEGSDNRIRAQLVSGGSEDPSLRLTSVEGGTETDLITGDWDRDTDEHTIRVQRRAGRNVSGEWQLWYDGESVGFAEDDWLPDSDRFNVTVWSTTGAIEVHRVRSW